MAKPQGATHLENERPPAEQIEQEELLEVVAGARSARAKIKDPTDQIRLSPNRTSGWPVGAPAGVTIHTEEGYHEPSVAWLRNPESDASAHWCIRRDGHIVQLVWERDRAWHARNSGMHYFGIEHEGSGFPHENGVTKFWKTSIGATTLNPDDKMLKASAQLVAYLCQKYELEPQHDFTNPALPRRDTKSIIAGHNQMAGNDHRDPGPTFPWRAYMNEVKALLRGD
jgi:N-acetyl-anhydromuramyl-L-alanine amidase AmpD